MKTVKSVSVIKRIISLLCAGVFLFLLIVVLRQDYPSENSLVYEDCTFIKYEYAQNSTRRTDIEYYYIYVEEYGLPLKIDNIVFDEKYGSALSRLKKGDKVKVSIEFYKEDSYFLYSMSCDGVDILSYDDYIQAHTQNNKYALIVCPILICMGTGLFVAEVIYYKKTGKSLPWPRSV